MQKTEFYSHSMIHMRVRWKYC